jgi:hypothetical protein
VLLLMSPDQRRERSLLLRFALFRRSGVACLPLSSFLPTILPPSRPPQNKQHTSLHVKLRIYSLCCFEECAGDWCVSHARLDDAYIVSKMPSIRRARYSLPAFLHAIDATKLYHSLD